MPKICPIFAKYMPNICPRNAQDMPSVCPWYTQDMPKLCIRYASDIPEICPIFDKISKTLIIEWATDSFSNMNPRDANASNNIKNVLKITVSYSYVNTTKYWGNLVRDW